MPLADLLDTYFAMQAPLPVTSPPATSSGAILDQLPAVDVAVRGRPLTEVLRPAYGAFGERDEPAE